MGLTVDDLLAVLRATVLHPVGSLVLLGASLVWDRMSGHLDAGGQTFGLLVKTALGCVAASWALHWNRSMSCRALNPAPRVPVSWPSEIVAVTGGSGGIGGELVRKLERLGATVAILDAVPPAFETGKTTHYFEKDVSSFEKVKSVHDAIVATLGSPTMLVANAGVLRVGTILDASEEEVRSTVGVNLLGVVFSVKAFVPPMVAANKGHVLVTSSVAAYSTPSVACYAASKAAVNSVVEGLQTELKHRHGNPSVKVSTVMPAAAKTSMFAQLELPGPDFAMPLLEPGRVADRMIQVLSSGSSEMALTPALANSSPLLHAMPTWVRVAVQDAGAHSTRRLSTAKTAGLA